MAAESMTQATGSSARDVWRVAASGDPVEMTLPALPLVSHSYQIVGSAHNGLEYLAEALDLVGTGAVKPMIETFPKERVGDAYKRAASGAVRFKAVVTY